jgi:hypothetical protein
MTEAKSEQEKENQFACYCILKWEWSFMMNTHAWHGKAPNDAQLCFGTKQ